MSAPPRKRLRRAGRRGTAASAAGGAAGDDGGPGGASSGEEHQDAGHQDGGSPEGDEESDRALKAQQRELEQRHDRLRAQLEEQVRENQASHEATQAMLKQTLAELVAARETVVGAAGDFTSLYTAYDEEMDDVFQRAVLQRERHMGEAVRARQVELDGAFALAMAEGAAATPTATPGSGAVVRINVGGTVFTTLRSTLCQIRNSMLEVMFRESVAAPVLADGSLFLDRNPDWFRHILGWLRDPHSAAAIETLPWDQPAFVHELRFFNLHTVLGVTSEVFVCGGQRGCSSDVGLASTYLMTTERYDVVTRTWRSAPPLPLSRKGCVGAAIHGRIFVLGGVQDVRGRDRRVPKFLAEVLAFDEAAGKWQRLASMGSRRCWSACCSIGDRIFVAGGRSDSRPERSAEVYDFDLNTWSPIADMHLSREGCAAACVGGEMYVAGGYENAQYLDSVERYSPADNAWTLLPPMPTARSGCTCVGFRGCFYVIGGVGAGGKRLKVVERLDPATGEWERLPDLNFNRSYCSAVCLNNAVYVLGGWISNKEQTASVERWDPRREAWVEEPRMLSMRAVSACAAI